VPDPGRPLDVRAGREVREGASVTVGNVMGVYYYEDISTHKVPESELTHLPTVTGATYPPPS